MPIVGVSCFRILREKDAYIVYYYFQTDYLILDILFGLYWSHFILTLSINLIFLSLHAISYTTSTVELLKKLWINSKSVHLDQISYRAYRLLNIQLNLVYGMIIGFTISCICAFLIATSYIIIKTFGRVPFATTAMELSFIIIGTTALSIILNLIVSMTQQSNTFLIAVHDKILPEHEIEKRMHKSLRILTLSIGELFYIQRSTFLTIVFKIIIENVVTILLTF